MKLFMIHCGFYDPCLYDGIYESHINLFVAAPNFEEAKNQVRKNPDFKERQMHVDGLQELQTINGFTVRLEPNPEQEGRTIILSNRYKDL